MHWADGIGFDRIVAALDEIATEAGDESLRPTGLLRRLAESGELLANVVAL
jgi:3-hydroxyacyl-CoA dehydrogenase